MNEASEPIRVAIHVNFPGFDLAARCADMPALVIHSVAAGEDLQRAALTNDALIFSAPTYSQALAATLRRSDSRVRWIQFASSGFDTALAYGVPEGVTVTNAGTAWAPTVAEHAVALLLALYRRIGALEPDRQKRAWVRAPYLKELRSLEGAVVGILGYGAIGREVARRLKPFGTHIVAVSRRAGPREDADESHTMTTLPALLPRFDAIVMALPQAPSTVGLLNDASLRAMKRSAVIVNVGRGASLDQSALLRALHEGRLAGAALDVFDPEPPPPDSPVWDAPNLIVSPHLAGFGGPQGVARLCDLCRDNIVRFGSGQALLNQVDLAAS
jgi:phosphoglycerate dehydrogenase-like enzyme